MNFEVAPILKGFSAAVAAARPRHVAMVDFLQMALQRSPGA